ncbi:C40 family peptidase [Streptomyces himalayensis]|uniref:C40 family peptidase n=1 Tax=Streptomyces himalayensis subsp. himalayensis TaxID=2756131 RepID=A0A7W0I709_9ACTN|nr:C40 family peptidase [Streptomyces himalayensis]MBA2944496.1 C40 family peptidase [Streptomyces himalayensis subsp. himalayensis]
MSGELLRLVCTGATTAALVLGSSGAGTGFAGPAAASSAVTSPGPGERSVSQLLKGLQRLYHDAEKATETYNATEEKLKRQRAEFTRLSTQLARARLDLYDSREAAGRLARQQYQGSSDISPYVQLLLARDPQHALDQGHVIQRVAKERAATVDRLVSGEKQADALATRARGALDRQLTLAEQQKKDRDSVRKRLKAVEKLIASLKAEQLARLRRAEEAEAARAQQQFLAAGALSGSRTPSKGGDAALRYAVRQIGKPYQWGAEGPSSFDCSGLTSQAWAHAGRTIPRTSQEQWAQLPRVPLRSLRPGDLVIYFREATHVAIYLGNGLVVQAPRPGAKVKVSPIAANPVLGAVRPDPGGKALARTSYVQPALPRGATAGADTGYGAAGAPGRG